MRATAEGSRLSAGRPKPDYFSAITGGFLKELRTASRVWGRAISAAQMAALMAAHCTHKSSVNCLLIPPFIHDDYRCYEGRQRIYWGGFATGTSGSVSSQLLLPTAPALITRSFRPLLD